VCGVPLGCVCGVCVFVSVVCVWVGGLCVTCVWYVCEGGDCAWRSWCVCGVV